MPLNKSKVYKYIKPKSIKSILWHLPLIVDVPETHGNKIGWCARDK